MCRSHRRSRSVRDTRLCGERATAPMKRSRSSRPSRSTVASSMPRSYPEADRDVPRGTRSVTKGSRRQLPAQTFHVERGAQRRAREMDSDARVRCVNVSRSLIGSRVRSPRARRGDPAPRTPSLRTVHLRKSIDTRRSGIPCSTWNTPPSPLGPIPIGRAPVIHHACETGAVVRPRRDLDARGSSPGERSALLRFTSQHGCTNGLWRRTSSARGRGWPPHRRWPRPLPVPPRCDPVDHDTPIRRGAPARPFSRPLAVRFTDAVPDCPRRRRGRSRRD